MTDGLLPFFLFLTSLTIVHLGAMAVAGLLARLPLTEFSLFLGPSLLHFRIAGVHYYLRAFPFGGSVCFSTQPDEQESLIQALSPGRRIAILLSGCAVLVVIAISCLGYHRGTSCLTSTLTQAIGALWPIAGKRLFLQALSLCHTGPAREAVGVLAAKLAVFNLLPIPLLNGGEVIMSIITAIHPVNVRVRERILKVSFVLILALLCLWGLGLVAAIFAPTFH